MRSRMREENIRVITEKLAEAFADKEDWLAVLDEAVYQYQKKTVRKMILKDHKRPDGRRHRSDPPAGRGGGYHPESTRIRHVYPWTDTDLQRDYTLAPLSEMQRLDGLDENETEQALHASL